jgi:oligopeptide/dipeptide ABC transporter ATP-binding protein
MQPLLQINNLNIAFETNRGLVRPVRDSNLTIYPGQTVALVGESGCGKSVTAMSILRLLPSPPAKYLSGEILFRRDPAGQPVDLLKLSEAEMRRIRGKDIAMIFQEPMTSLNPVYTIGDQIVEAVTLHQGFRGREAYDVAEQALRDVGISDPGRRLHEYPHQMSGGMRQRVMIAMALSCQPKLLIADEPTTALDVTIQAQILELLRHLQQSRNMAILMITHDLGVVAENADVVNVMYASRVVETATVEELFDKPIHPYTEGLFRSMPKLGEQTDRLLTIPGTVPNPAKFPAGCKFHTRCHRAQSIAATLPSDQTVEVASGDDKIRVPRVCAGNEPELRELHDDHWAACHRLPGYDQATVTRNELAHKRTVLPQTIDSEAVGVTTGANGGAAVGVPVATAQRASASTTSEVRQ